MDRYTARLICLTAIILSALTPAALGAYPSDAGNGHEIKSNPSFPAAAELESDNVADVHTANLDDNLFRDPVPYPVGNGPSSVAAGDLDDDGHLDLVTANFYGASLSVLMGAGDGTFGEGLSYPSGSNPSFVVLEDFDGDGHLDLAATMSFTTFPRHISVRQGNGDGTFQPPQDYETDDGARWIASGDFNGDTVPDLVVANSRENTVSALLGNGDGTFNTAVHYLVGGDDNMWPFSVAVEDMNLDGIPDLVTANEYTNDVSILTGVGDGTFQLASRHSVGPLSIMWPNAIVIGDFDANGLPDVATANRRSDNISILLGTSDGTFHPPVLRPVEEGPVFLTVGDLNIDGNQDLVVGYETYPPPPGDLFSILFGNEDGSFQPAEHYDAQHGTYSIAIADLDSDQAPDLAVTNSDPGTVSIYLNRMGVALGTVAAQLTCTPASGILPFSSIFQASMTNQSLDQARRFHGVINATLANGLHLANWRIGLGDVPAGEVYSRQWTQIIPALPRIVGGNLFELTATDVTPPPYNQPPYPPAGDTDTGICTVTGVAP